MTPDAKQGAADPVRRSVLQAAAGIAVAQLGLDAASAQGAAPAPGKPGEFDFLAGEWRISHRRLKTPGGNDWDTFAGEATCWTILAGMGSVEELRIPERNFSGMGLRLLDRKQNVWCDYWVNSKDGILTPPPTTGGFRDGEGVFIAEDTDAGKPIKVRGVWDRITAKSCRWHQASSRDGGKTWQPNWFMDWTRA